MSEEQREYTATALATADVLDIDADLTDPVNHPSHYTSHPSGVECITITQHYNFNIGNAIKYLWRAGLKHDAVEDLKKAAKYINFELKRVGAKC